MIQPEVLNHNFWGDTAGTHLCVIVTHLGHQGTSDRVLRAWAEPTRARPPVPTPQAAAAAKG